MNPTDADESAMVKLLKRGRVGSARVRLHKEHYWELDFAFPCGVRVKRMRKYFKSPTNAYRAAVSITKELKRHGEAAIQLTGAQRIEAVMCLDKLKMVESSLTEAVDYFIKRHPLGGLKRTIEDVAAELMGKKRKTNLRDHYLDALEYKWKKFAEEFPNRRIGSVTTENLESSLAKHPNWGPATIRSEVSSWKVLFYYAMKRGYCVENPCLRIELPRKLDKEVQICDVETVRKTMDAAKAGDLDCTTYLAIGFFAGIRPDEISKLRWEQVDFVNKTIVVLSGSAKGRARRIVDMAPNLIAWLTPYRKESGAVLRHEVTKLRVTIRDRMGLAKWPHNIMRHSYASYHFAKHRNEHLLMTLMGHGDDGRILHNHYRALVQPLAAEAFWAIYPS